METRVKEFEQKQKQAKKEAYEKLEKTQNLAKEAREKLKKTIYKIKKLEGKKANLDFEKDKILV